MERGTVVLVEADEQVRTSHRAALENAGYRVVEGQAGDQAVRLVHEEAPSILVMRCSLPGVTGIRVTSVLKEEPELADLPIILLGSDESGNEPEEARRVGCDAYLAESCRVEQLLREIQWLTRVVRGRNRRRRPAPRMAGARPERGYREIDWADARMRRTWSGLHRA